MKLSANSAYGGTAHAPVKRVFKDAESFGPLDTLAHREHVKIVFGSPTDGKLFQVYDENRNPLMLEPALFVLGTNNIVNFERYAAFVWAQILVFLHNLGNLMAQYLRSDIHGSSMRVTKCLYLKNEPDVIIAGPKL